jgi:hypothetical protein
MALPGHDQTGVPQSVGSQAFLAPFVFPSGRQCRTFDELAMACQEDWSVARDLLQQGFFEGFLGGLGRADLAQAARDSARFPDRDRGLDRLLGELPTNVLIPPRIFVEPLEVHLGVLKPGADRRFALHLENRGMRLLYGSLACDNCDWLALGDAPGATEKLFQFGSESDMPIHVKGKLLRASTKPLAGRLLVESNGGTLTVTIRADVPVTPFPDGVLRGAMTPRQVAEKAKAAPKEAAAYFENGAVPRWYSDNGWTYPVQGPAASGLGAVQQFFEALGLTPPPKVEISESSLALLGTPGDSLQHVLEVKTQEKRPVYAHATSNQPWLEVGRIQLDGRTATIPLSVPRIPDREGETLTATVVVQANGNQRFVVPVTLTVSESLLFDTPGRPSTPPVAQPPSTPPAVLPAASTPASSPAAPSVLARKSRLILLPRSRQFLHLVPVVLLSLILCGTLILDLTWEPRKGGPTELVDTEPRLGIQFADDRVTFGITMLKEYDPKEQDKHKRLTFDEAGKTNNTCIRIDNFEYLFGVKDFGNFLPKRKLVMLKKDRSWESQFEFTRQRVRVTQTVALVPGEQSQILDTCLVRYTINNRSSSPHKIGLRVLLDTFIGANDGVPFVIPGQPGLLVNKRKFDEKDIPDYIQALENADLANPGTVAHIALRIPDVEPVERMVIAAWPGEKARWDWEPEAMNRDPRKPDSSVALYWPEREMKPSEKRELGFTYGLGTLSAEGAGGLALTVGGDFRPNQVFTVTAYLKKPQAGQIVRLSLPSALSLAPGVESEQEVTGGGEYTQVSWRVRAEAVGDYMLEATAAGNRATYRVKIRPGTIY